jgi:hypothetical protein
METRRLRTLQQPAQLEKLLGAFVARGEFLPDGCYQIRDAAALPSPLQEVVTRTIEEGRVWVCWANAHDTWLFTCEMSLALSRERGAPVLRVNRYAESGELTDAGSWMTDPDGKWHRCAD